MATGPEMPGMPEVQEALADAPGIPRCPEGPVFREPWEAQAFAILLALRASGLVGGEEWSEALGHEIGAAQAAGDPGTGETYYLHWLRALENLVTGKHLASTGTLDRYRDAWARAAARTAHGTPIELAPEDFGASR